jgi:hypothetical protein
LSLKKRYQESAGLDEESAKEKTQYERLKLLHRRTEKAFKEVME